MFRLDTSKLDIIKEENSIIEDLFLDNTYKYLIDTNSNIDNTIDIYDIDILISKGFKISNSTLNNYLYINKDKYNNTWYADCNSNRYIAFIQVNNNPDQKGLLYSSRTMKRSELEELFPDEA